ncbi:MAG: homoserine kinase [Actinomycetaceae bacterium]|nr:homoserine kinase [Actinomycetaceae bacterium]
MRLQNDHVRVRVPATSANLGPGFDTAGLALGIYDEIELRAIAGQTRVTVHGYGEDSVPTDERNLVVQATRRTLDYLDASQVGLLLTARNRIPHASGLGSSAAAVVAGILLARGLAGEGAMTDEEVLELATQMEGHPDNAAPAIFGGVTFSWTVEPGRGARSIALPAPERMNASVLIPHYSVATSAARAALPEVVAHEDARFNVARTGLLALILAGKADPRYLMDATDDRLHQRQRSETMPQTYDLVCYLRERGLPAVVSGAGPTVLVLAQLSDELCEEARQAGWRVEQPGISPVGATWEATKEAS